MDKEKINLVPDKAKCSGCGACAAVCSQNAITMQEERNGCKYPQIDPSLCLNCGRCMKVCSYREMPENHFPIAAYAACGQERELVKRSASGGVFATLAQSWIQKGGLAAGAVMDIDEHVKVYHVLSDRLEDVRRMQGSKYVQSDAWLCYRDIMQALKAGKQVLFSGTPCQAAAIRALTGDPDNLTTIDLICHGVPPLRMLDEYLRILERRFRAKIAGFSFRNKNAKKKYCASFELRRGMKQRRIYLNASMLSYYKYFLDSTLCRENCYACPFAQLQRAGDITIGDFWGAEEAHQKDFAQGTMTGDCAWSCILVNTEKGRRLISQAENNLLLVSSKVEWIAKANHQLQHPARMPEERTELIREYEKSGFRAMDNLFVKKQGGKMKYTLRVWKQLGQLKKAANGK